MSHYYWLNCTRCDTTSDSINRGQDLLREAAEDAWAARALLESGLWDLRTVETMDGPAARGLCAFVALHAACNAFTVEDEYHEEPLHVKVRGAPDPCDTCADRGFVPCPTCKPIRHVRMQSDAKMRAELRKAATEQVT